MTDRYTDPTCAEHWPSRPPIPPPNPLLTATIDDNPPVPLGTREGVRDQRVDAIGPLRLITTGEGWAMVRRPRAMPFVMRVSEWEQLPKVNR